MWVLLRFDYKLSSQEDNIRPMACLEKNSISENPKLIMSTPKRFRPTKKPKMIHFGLLLFLGGLN